MIQDQRIKRFLDAYPRDFEVLEGTTWTGKETHEFIGYEPDLFTDFMSNAASLSHGQGIIRFLFVRTNPSIIDWNSEHGWKKSWPQWAQRLSVFAYDWNGSLFGFDRARKSQREFLVSILEPDTGKLLQTPHTFADLIGKAAIEEADAALSRSYYEEWKRSGGDIPKPGFCVGCKVPLFLNGSDSVQNLGVQPLIVYVDLCGQMFSQTRNISPGTRITGITIR